MSNSNLPVKTGQTNISPVGAANNILNARAIALQATQYSTRITSANPCAFVLLIDQSGSMSDEIANNRDETLTKSESLALIVNKFLEEIVLTCIKTDIIKDYFELLIIGYGRLDENDESIVSVAWEGPLKEKTWVTVNELRNGSIRKNIVTVPNPRSFGPKTLQEEINVWIEAYAEGLTPMKAAFGVCAEYLEEWVFRHPNSFPPIVFNMTDGAVSDVEEYSELINAAEKIKSISTSDGNVLLLNLLLTDNTERQKEFPLISERQLFENEEFETALFDASSTIPINLLKFISNNLGTDEEVKGVVFSSLESVIRFLNIGTSTLRNNTN